MQEDDIAEEQEDHLHPRVRRRRPFRHLDLHPQVRREVEVPQIIAEIIKTRVWNESTGSDGRGAWA